MSTYDLTLCQLFLTLFSTGLGLGVGELGEGVGEEVWRPAIWRRRRGRRPECRRAGGKGICARGAKIPSPPSIHPWQRPNACTSTDSTHLNENLGRFKQAHAFNEASGPPPRHFATLLGVLKTAMALCFHNAVHVFLDFFSLFLNFQKLVCHKTIVATLQVFNPQKRQLRNDTKRQNAVRKADGGAKLLEFGFGIFFLRLVLFVLYFHGSPPFLRQNDNNPAVR